MVFMLALRDDETQKRGVVGIPYNVGRDHTKDREAVWKAAKLVSILPFRFTAIHYCFSDEKVQLLFSLAKFVFNKSARIRCRLHMGTHMECIYKLVSAYFFFCQKKNENLPKLIHPALKTLFSRRCALLTSSTKIDDIRYSWGCNTCDA